MLINYRITVKESMALVGWICPTADKVLNNKKNTKDRKYLYFFVTASLKLQYYSFIPVKKVSKHKTSIWADYQTMCLTPRSNTLYSILEDVLVLLFLSLYYVRYLSFFLCVPLPFVVFVWLLCSMSSLLLIISLNIFLWILLLVCMYIYCSHCLHNVTDAWAFSDS